MTEKRFAILIASSAFPDEPGLQPLTLPERDVDGFHDVLAAPELGGFTDVVVIKNRPHHEALRAINRALKQAEQDDLVLIYYSGHGKLDGAGRLYLATADTELAVLESTSIPVHAIRSLIDVGQTTRSALILDCCYSGAVGTTFRGSVNEELSQMSSGRGTFIMTASTGIQTAQEKEGDAFGLFTKHVINGIRSGEADRDCDGYITMTELYNYVHDNVLRESAQEPMRWTINVRGELVVARSGKTTREERRQAIRGLLFDLARQGVLPDSVLTSAINTLSIELPRLTSRQKEQDALLNQLAEGAIQTGDLIEKWQKIQDRAEPRTVNEAPEIEPHARSRPDPPTEPKSFFSSRLKNYRTKRESVANFESLKNRLRHFPRNYPKLFRALKWILAIYIVVIVIGLIVSAK